MTKPATDRPQSDTRVWLIPVIVVAVVAAVLIGYVLTTSQPDSTHGAQPGQHNHQPSGTPASDAPVDPNSDLTKLETRDEHDPLAVGRADAPVGLIVFSDYQCKYCAKWNHETLPKLMPYVERGELRIEWRDANIFGEPSQRGARAAYAAGKQGKLQQFHERVFANGSPRPAGQLSDESLKADAEALGLNLATFEKDYNASETRTAVAANEQLSRDLGVFSTPAFLLAGQPIMGAQPTQTFVDEFNKALERKRK